MNALTNNPWFIENGWVVPCALLALGVAVFVYEIASQVMYPRELLGGTHPFELQRRGELRKGNWIFRQFEPMIENISSRMGRHQSAAMEALQTSLLAAREKLPWKPEEFVVTKWIEGVVFGVVLFALLWFSGFKLTSVLLGLAVTLLYGFLTPRSIADRAEKRLSRIRIRLPFAVDLIALTMEAGGGFQECLQTAVAENGDHPLTVELAEVLRQISLGRPRSEALKALQDRLHDEDINELVFAINKGEELGTPLASILREQAEQMRLKRSQRGEKAAAECEVKIIFPGMVLMIACLIVIITPIILPPIFELL
jgi:tight adherence protein C